MDFSCFTESFNCHDSIKTFVKRNYIRKIHTTQEAIFDHKNLGYGVEMQTQMTDTLKIVPVC